MVDMDTIVSLAKRRGFIFQSSEIYGGLASTWDYGPLGVELKRNVKDAWWRTFVHQRDDMVGLDAAILMASQVWVASGHVGGFSDPLVECKACHHRFRADHIDYDKYVVPNFVELDFAEVQIGPRYNSDGTRQFRFDDLSIRFLSKKQATAGPLIRSVLLRIDGHSPYSLVSVDEYIASKPSPEYYTPASTAVDGTGSFVVTDYADQGIYGAEFPKIPVQIANHVNMISLEIAVPEIGEITIEYNPTTGQLNTPSCPDCGGELTEPRQFNLMFKTFLGPVEDEAAQTYLRPETAQGIFVNFQNVLMATRRKLPFGIAQVGKSFRNEITVGNFIFRTREFEQMEIEYFVKPGTDEEWHQRWIQDCLRWYTDMGLSPDRLRVRPHEAHELSHYSKATSDIEYAFPWGWGEIQGIANRTDFDLKAHTQASGVTLNYFDDETQQHLDPYVIEPSAGVDRALLAFLLDAYREEEAPTADGKTEKRVLLKLHPALAPIKVAVLPLSRNQRLVPKARQVYDLVRQHFVCQYDDAQSIGRRYRRQDEVGTPLCVTVDFQTVDEDDAVTIRHRDSMEQVRVPVAELVSALAKRLAT